MNNIKCAHCNKELVFGDLFIHKCVWWKKELFDKVFSLPMFLIIAITIETVYLFDLSWPMRLLWVVLSFVVAAFFDGFIGGLLK